LSFKSSERNTIEVDTLGRYGGKMIFFTADNHFCHKNVIRYENRPFNSTDEMDDYMIKVWNETVNPHDDVYILGDFIFDKKGMVASDIIQKLNGKLHMIKGNHDFFLDKTQDLDVLFEWVKDYHEFKYNHIKFILFHYPIASWHFQKYGSIHVHGHIHKAKINLSYGRAFNAGVDVNDFRPVSIEYVIQSFEEQILEEQREGE